MAGKKEKKWKERKGMVSSPRALETNLLVWA